MGGWPRAAVGLGLVPRGCELLKPSELYPSNLGLFCPHLHFSMSSKNTTPSSYPDTHLKRQQTSPRAHEVLC